VSELLTPSYQETSLIAMLRYFDCCLRDEEDDGSYSIVIKIDSRGDDPNRWTVHLGLGGFEAEGDGITFALAWDALMACCDEQFADNYAAAKRNDVDISKPTLMVDNLHDWREKAKDLTPQEVEIVMNLRRRGATPDPYVIFLDVNAEDNPGAWSVDERKRTIGDADTLGAAWDERF
jgi:hypothetical protein